MDDRLNKYILLNDRVGELSEKGLLSLSAKIIPNQFLRGELLESLVEADQPKDPEKIALTCLAKKSSKLECPTSEVAKLTNSEADLLMAVNSAEERFCIYREKNRLEVVKDLSVGDQVLVKVKAHSRVVQGVILYIGSLPSHSGTIFGVELLSKDAIGHGTTDGTFRNKKYFDCPQDCGVFVGMDKIRPYNDSSLRSPRKERREQTSSSHKSSSFGPEDVLPVGLKSKKDHTYPNYSQKLKIDQKVVAFVDDQEQVEGYVRYIAETPEPDGSIPVGIELLERKGRGTGMFKGRQRFVCKEGYGLFVPASTIIPVEDFYGYQQQEQLSKSGGIAISTSDKLRQNSQNRLANEQQLEATRTKLENERQQHQVTRTELEIEIQQHQATSTELDNERQQHQATRTELQNERQQRENAQTQHVDEQQRRLAIERELDNEQNAQNRDWILDREEIQVTSDVLGIGGWGSVKRGRFRGTTVAVKEIHGILHLSSNYYRRIFQREMQMAARCRHPCLLQFIGATNDDNTPLFVTELLETNLRAVLENSERYCDLETDKKISIFLDVATALNYLHLNRPTPIMHRDISSANVLLWRHGDNWRAKVSDYGAANFMYHCSTIGPGAPPYSAPEARTSRQTTKIDVFSYGVLMLEVNTREFPDPGSRVEQLQMVPDGPLKSLITRCLAEDPEERPTMAEIIPFFKNLGDSQSHQ